jgi:hypothetical protein
MVGMIAGAKKFSPNPTEANMELCRGFLFGQCNSSIILSRQIPEEFQE